MVSTNSQKSRVSYKNIIKKMIDKKNDNEAFLKSIIGTSPIKKQNKIKKDMVFTETNNINKIHNNKKIEKKIFETPIKNYDNFKLEKTNINKKLKKGKISVDRKIDFHGMSVIDAEDVFVKTIKTCYLENLRCLLFVTGKGILKKYNSDDQDISLYYGKIRKNFLSWVEKKENQRYVLSVQEASIEYGADGAFFVYLRKKNNHF